jgi:hypothetical protein
MERLMARKQGRPAYPPGRPKRDKKVQIAVTPDEKTRFEKAKDAARMSGGDFLMHLLDRVKGEEP